MKAKRQALIREIVESQSIQTQEELAEALRAHGMVVTQATVSRDIKEMHLLKVLAEDGNYRYATIDKNDQGVGDRLIRMLADSLVDINRANNLIVIKTLSGSAHVAVAARQRVVGARHQRRAQNVQCSHFGRWLSAVQGVRHGGVTRLGGAAPR